MASEHKNPVHTFREHFLNLPRELRDLIYAEVFSNSESILLGDVQASLEALPLLTSKESVRNITSEVAEAFYTYSTFKVRISEPQLGEPKCAIGSSMFPRHEQNIRKLVVHAEEAFLAPATSLEALEKSCRAGWHETRALWENLLQLPRLEQLDIYFQKQVNDRFCWADFCPVLVQLRERTPDLCISFNVSFDSLLARYWTDPIWDNNTEPGNVIEEPYKPMGFVNVTDLIGPPTQDDVAYVQEHLKRDKETYGRDILRGLLDETVPHRRALASHYVVKEPALLRSRIMEHYELYKQIQGDV